MVCGVVVCVQPLGVDYRLQILGSFDIHNNFHLHH